MPDAFISKVVRSGSCLEFISTACMRYRRGRPAKASRRESYVRTEFMTNGIRS